MIGTPIFRHVEEGGGLKRHRLMILMLLLAKPH